MGCSSHQAYKKCFFLLPLIKELYPPHILMQKHLHTHTNTQKTHKYAYHTNSYIHTFKHIFRMNNKLNIFYCMNYCKNKYPFKIN